MDKIHIFVLLFAAPIVIGINVKIDGTIDLGPNWNWRSARHIRAKPAQPYFTVIDSQTDTEKNRPKMIDIIIKNDGTNYRLSNSPDTINPSMHDRNDLRSDKYSHKIISKTDNDQSVENKSITHLEPKLDETEDDVNTFKGVTTLVNHVSFEDMYVSPRTVKDDETIKEFTIHTYEQSVKVLNNIKDTVSDYEIKREVDSLIRNYENKFGAFVRDTQKHKIKTRLGQQKVILNTMDTSNRIIDRLVNHLIGKMSSFGSLRNDAVDNVFKKELTKKIDLENKHICKKMQICRSEKSFSNFLVQIMTIILTANDVKVKQVGDAGTEVLKNTDFSSVFDADTQKRFDKGISDLESYDAAVLRPIFYIIKNIVAFKNNPIKVVGNIDSRVNKTMAFLEIIEMWDKKLPANEFNVKQRENLTKKFEEWRDGKRHDITELMQEIIAMVVIATRGFDNNQSKTFERNINVILGY